MKCSLLSTIILLSLLAGMLTGSSSAQAAAEPPAVVLSPTTPLGLPALSANWVGESEQQGSEYGYAVAGAGDVNGDGYPDALVGAPKFEDQVYKEGVIFLYNGSVKGLSSEPIWKEGSAQKGAYFGGSVAGGGDVNGDGFADLLTGAYLYNNGTTKTGAAFVYYGSDSGPGSQPDWQAVCDDAGAEFGRSVSFAGDVNDDGYDDIVVGAQWYSDGQSDLGAAFLYYGSAGGLSQTPDVTLTGSQPGAGFGRAVSSAGDVNGDGFDDVVVGAPLHDFDQVDEGAVFIYEGYPEGVRLTPSWIFQGNQPGSEFGSAVASAGDLDQDGYTDLIVGAPDYDASIIDSGAAFVYFGSHNGPGFTPAKVLDSFQSYSRYGTSVGSAGDFNADGYPDLVIGAYLYEYDQPDEGTVIILSGGPNRLNNPSTRYAFGDKADTWLGFAVAGIGDVNADGADDLIAGAPQFRSSEIIVGRAFAFYGVRYDAIQYWLHLPLLLWDL